MQKSIDVGFIGDIHLGHKAIAKMRGFDDIDEYNKEVIKRINSVVNKKTLLILVGDITMETRKYYPLLKEINCRLVVVGGNHDTKELIGELLNYVESVVGAFEYKGFIITHIPIHPSCLERYRANIHAHLHEKEIFKYIYEPLNIKVKRMLDENYICVSWDQLNGIPMSLEQAIAINAKNKSVVGLG